MTLSDVEIIEEMESWDSFAGALRAEDRTLFANMLRLCYQYFPAMQAKESPFPSEALFMSLLLVQHRTIVWLAEEVEKLRGKKDEGLAV